MASVRRRLQRVPWLAIGAVAALVLGLVPQTSFPARAGQFSLWGDSSQGWGLSPTSMSSPGPLLTVSVGETVTLDLFAADSLPHTWCVDYNRNNVCDSVGEHESGVFSSPSTPLTHTFVVPNNPGLFNYGCGVHGFTPMNGPIRIVLSVRPVVSIASPAGSQDWTGGSTHDVVWTMTDPNDPVTALVAYLNYTNGGAPVPIAGPVPGTANPPRRRSADRRVERPGDRPRREQGVGLAARPEGRLHGPLRRRAGPRPGVDGHLHRHERDCDLRRGDEHDRDGEPRLRCPAGHGHVRVGPGHVLVGPGEHGTHPGSGLEPRPEPDVHGGRGPDREGRERPREPAH